MKRTLTATVVVLSILFSIKAFAHCEIPCGIYDDQLRVQLIKEHIGTIEKSMKKIEEYSKAGAADYNQLVRWVANKEQHATEVQEIVSQYFLHQRVKPVAKGAEGYETYLTQLTALHEVLIKTMKAKQSVNLELIKEIQKALADFEKSYFHDHTH